MDGSAITYSVRISGRVQGVNFRASTKQRADELGVTGWVKNEPDGTVSALIQHSDSPVLQQMLEWLRAGPPSAQVDELVTQRVAGETELADFRIER